MRAGALAFAVIATLGSAAGFAPKVFAQADEPLVATASEWGGQGGVFTCAQWRAYVTRMYRLGDPRHRGYIEAKDFEIIKKASPVFQTATFDYFDMAGKGRVTQKEFVEFESPFFARFDKKNTCHVTSEDIRAANTPATQTQTKTPEQHSGPCGGSAVAVRGGGGIGGGGGGGFGGWRRRVWRRRAWRRRAWRAVIGATGWPWRSPRPVRRQRAFRSNEIVRPTGNRATSKCWSKFWSRNSVNSCGICASGGDHGGERLNNSAPLARANSSVQIAPVRPLSRGALSSNAARLVFSFTLTWRTQTAPSGDQPASKS